MEKTLLGNLVKVTHFFPILELKTPSFFVTLRLLGGIPNPKLNEDED